MIVKNRTVDNQRSLEHILEAYLKARYIETFSKLFETELKTYFST